MGTRRRDRTKRCIRCVQTHDDDPDSSKARERERMKERRAAAKLLENHPEERNTHEGVITPGWGFVPVLSGPFGRLNATGHEAQYKSDRPWADEEIAA